MHVLNHLRVLGKPALYEETATVLRGLLAGEGNLIARAANMSSLLYWSLPDLNWVGFYLRDDASDDLIVGPFQGKPACVRIPLGRGVCGAAAAQRRTLIVPDVHEFPGHIACDSASNSEIVVPVIADGRLLGVLDLDSPLLNRFDEDDARGLERLVAEFVNGLDNRLQPTDPARL
jgi:GAF domain-containing protein